MDIKHTSNVTALTEVRSASFSWCFVSETETRYWCMALIGINFKN